MRISGALVAVTAVLVLTLGVSAAVAAHGWSRHTVRSQGFSLETPSLWFDATSGPQGALDRAARKYPELASLVQWAEGNQLVRLLCSARTGFPNVSVTVANTYRALTVKKFAASNVAELRHLPSLVGTPVITEVTLPAGESYEVTFAETSQGTRFDEQEYFLRHSNRAYVIAYTVVDPPDTATLATLTQSIRSFAFTKP